jgi:hypothetical protein
MSFNYRWLPEWRVPVWMMKALMQRLAVEAALKVRRAAEPEAGPKDEDDELLEREALMCVGNDSDEESARCVIVCGGCSIN